MSSTKRRIFGLLCLVALCAYPAMDARAQTITLPTPTGPYSIGRVRYDWVDQSRADTIDAAAGGKREIVVWVWYPATPKADTAHAEWLPGPWEELYASALQRMQPDDVKLQSQGVDHAVSVHAYRDAPVAAGHDRYPVLVFSPGFGVLPTTYTALIEDIVSHGYIVAGIVPTYFVPVAMFDDGRVVPGRSIGPIVAQTTLVGDVAFTLDELQKVDTAAASPLHDRLDLTRVGVFGHSRGGATSFQVAKENARVKVAVDIDGTLVGSVAQQGVAKPLALILSGEFLAQQQMLESAPPDDPRRRVLEAYDVVLRSASPGYRVILPATTHMAFSDMPWLPMMSASYKQTLSSIDPTRALRVAADYLEAFFDQHLKGKPSSLLERPSDQYPEARLTTYQK
jgi:predicted dienelactone hydrolase